MHLVPSFCLCFLVIASVCHCVFSPVLFVICLRCSLWLLQPKEPHPAGLIIHHADHHLDQVSHHQRDLQIVRQRNQNSVTFETANLDHSRLQPVQGLPVCNYRYECPYCGKRFAATNNLRGHLVKHTGIKEFVCHLCGNEYAFKQKLKYHLNIVHQLQIWWLTISNTT